MPPFSLHSYFFLSFFIPALIIPVVIGYEEQGCAAYLYIVPKCDNYKADHNREPWEVKGEDSPKSGQQRLYICSYLRNPRLVNDVRSLI